MMMMTMVVVQRLLLLLTIVWLLRNFGGDGLLVAACATAAVSGLQGDGGSGPNTYLGAGHIVAEAKHFGGYGGSSKDGAPVEVGMGALHDIYLRPWKVRRVLFSLIRHRVTVQLFGSY